MNKRVAIVILNYKNWQDTIECLQTVINITYNPCRIIVVDNDSRNDSLVQIKTWLSKNSRESLMLTREQSENSEFKDHDIVLIQSDYNRGYAAGNNIGIRWAIRGGDRYTLILNNDTLVEEGFLEPLVEFLEINPSTAVAGPKVVNLEGNIVRVCARRRPDIGDSFFRVGYIGRLLPNNRWCRKHYYIGEYNYHEPRQVDLISGSCMLIRTDVIQEVGLLDENTFLFLEEFILHEKLQSLNMGTYIIPQSQIIHKGGQSTGKVPSPFVVRTYYESLEYYLKVYRRYPNWLLYIQVLMNRLHYFGITLKYSWQKVKTRAAPRKTVS